jgi:hypothetical protein
MIEIYYLEQSCDIRDEHIGRYRGSRVETIAISVEPNCVDLCVEAAFYCNI